MSTDSNDQDRESGERLRASELKRALEEADAPWLLDNDIGDEVSPPEFPLGGEVPPDAPKGDQAEPTDFAALLREHPPADPDLARFCIEAGLLDPGAALAAERPPPDQRPRPDEVTPDNGPRPLDQPPAPDDPAPPVFGERAEWKEPE